MTEAGTPGFFRDTDGRLVVFQAPNPAIGVFLAATALRWSPWDGHDTELMWLGRGALIAWALDELLRGAAPVRRLYGLVVLTYEAFVLFQR